MRKLGILLMLFAFMSCGPTTPRGYSDTDTETYADNDDISFFDDFVGVNTSFVVLAIIGGILILARKNYKREGLAI